jgi:YHS domain-containing protein
MSCCDNKNEDKQIDEKSQSVCLIMENTVDKAGAEKKGLVREYKGKKYYFCCDGCPEKFDKNPEGYTNKN